VAGESPGKEQDKETSGEVADRIARDPRLAVLRTPTGTREVREALRSSDIREVRATGDTAGTASASGPPAPGAADGPTAAARPHASSASTPSATADTANDVADVDSPPATSTSQGTPAPRASASQAVKTESNRDAAAGTDEADESSEAAGTEGDAPAHAPAPTPTAESRARTGGAHPDETAASGDDEKESGTAEASADASGEASGDEDTPEAPKDQHTTSLRIGALAAPKDAEVKPAPKDAEPKPAPKDAEPKSAPRNAEPKPETKDAEPKPAPKDAEPKPAPKSEPVVRPLVSDLYGRPAGEPGGAVTFGAPGEPTRARSVPPAPPTPPGKAPLPPAEDAGSGEGEDVGPQGTRTMPVPPTPDRDPLKLLAELTNTPPPPQTLLRTTARRVKIWTPLVVLLALVFVLVQALRPLPSPSLASTTAATYTFNGTPLPQSMPWPSQGQTAVEVEGLGSLGVRGAQTPVPIASVTKVMTAYVILRDHPLSGKQNGPVITVDAQAAAESQSTEESTAKVKKDQKFTERQMLQLLLVPSGNNIARLLARWDAGTQEAFVAKMKKTAAGLGMTHTTYTGASGFESTTRSTAVDQLKLAREVMKNDVFRSVVALPNVNIPGVGTIYNNNNDLVHLGVVGIKTGSSTPAGGALMWAAHRTIDGKQQLILGVVLQQRGGVTVNDSLNVALARSQDLINSVQAGLTSVTILKKGEVVGEVEDGLGGRTAVVASADLKAIGWPGMTTAVTLTPPAAGLPHDAKAGTQVGTIGFGTGAARTSVPVVLQSDLHAPSFGKKLIRLG
jgi:serine-type D-Ala-D-Ala carboxypeptidase (penicillin-binding protein 5/6)